MSGTDPSNSDDVMICLNFQRSHSEEQGQQDLVTRARLSLTAMDNMREMGLIQMYDRRGVRGEGVVGSHRAVLQHA
jgi:hypothetical protein